MKLMVQTWGNKDGTNGGDNGCLSSGVKRNLLNGTGICSLKN